MDAAGDILFSAFLAGALLKNKAITYVELVNDISIFENTTDYNIVDDGLTNLLDIVCDQDYEIRLKKNYDDLYKKNCTIKEHLYSMTNSVIRKFFELEEKQSLNDIDCALKKQGILKKIRTRVLNIL